MDKYSVVIVGDVYVKRTARFGPFYGRMIFTKDQDQARRWTRRKDAEACAGIIVWRIETYKEHEHLKGITPNVVELV